MKFEDMNKAAIQSELRNRGWFQNKTADPNVAGQLHSWFIPSNARGVSARRYTLRNAAIAAGIISR